MIIRNNEPLNTKTLKEIQDNIKKLYDMQHKGE